MKLTKKGRRLLRLAVQRIQHMPSTFNMKNWLLHDESVKRRRSNILPGYCGTVGCLAGHIVLADSVKRAHLLANSNSDDIPNRARRLLFGNIPQADENLFFTDLWPDTFRERYESSRTNRTKARVLKDRVEHFIKTKGE